MKKCSMPSPPCSGPFVLLEALTALSGISQKTIVLFPNALTEAPGTESSHGER